jgi:uncharacterized membrane protein
MNPWLLVAIIVCATTGGEVLQTMGMKRHGEIHDFRIGALGAAAASIARHWHVPASIVLMAISFFSFITLLSVADLSFAVPATAGSIVLETILAKLVLKERVSRMRWMGACLVACGVALLAV